MKLFDTHSHMYLEAFDEDRDACMARASERGVSRVALPNIDRSSIAALRSMLLGYPEQCVGMMGLHPCSVKEDWEEELEIILKELDTGLYCAVGEIGLDFYWDTSFRLQQIEAFEQQIVWAKERKLAIAIHCRESFAEVCEVLDRQADSDLRGVFHCFTGGLEDVERALAFPNFYLGIGGVLTFKNSGLDRSIAEVPLERMVLETDAPYLAPTPFRGKRNETAYTRLVAEKLASVSGYSLEEVARVSSANAKNLFGIDSDK